MEKMDRVATSSTTRVEGCVDKPHVLLVDDSVVDRKLAEKLFKVFLCKVTAVESGSNALQYLGLVDGNQSSENDNKQEVNMLVTDYDMPGMTGYELLQKTKESSSTKDLPVVIMSSDNQPARINQCIEAGAKLFMSKPLKLSDVEKAMAFVQ